MGLAPDAETEGKAMVKDAEACAGIHWIVRQGKEFYLEHIEPDLVMTTVRHHALRFRDSEGAHFFARRVSRAEPDVRVCRVRHKHYSPYFVMPKSPGKVSP